MLTFKKIFFLRQYININNYYHKELNIYFILILHIIFYLNIPYITLNLNFLPYIYI